MQIVKYCFPVLLLACELNSGPVYFSSGTYVMDTYYTVSVAEEYLPEIETANFNIDLESGAIALTGTSQDASFSITEREKRDYEVHCPMQMSATMVQTFDIAEEVVFLGQTLNNAFIAADRCDVDEISNYIVLRSVDENHSDTSFYLKKQ